MSKYLELNKENGSLFDLKINNSTYSIILFSNEDIETEMNQVFYKLLENDQLELNYYVLQKFFSQLSYNDTDGVIKCIIKAVENKISLIKEAIKDNDERIDLGIYTQLWNSYREYFKKIYLLVNNYQRYLLNKNIKVKNFQMNLLSIIEISMFYNGIISGKNDFFQQISKNIHNIDKANIDQLVNYVDSIKLFSYVKDYLDNQTDILDSINEIINKPKVINILCFYLDKLLKSTVNKEKLLLKEDYCTINPKKIKNKIIRSINKIVNILSYHSEREILFLHYNKYFKTRIFDSQYNNNKLEIQIIKKLSICLGKDYSQKLINTIQSIDASNAHNKNIHNAIIKVVHGEYNVAEPDPKILNPVVIHKKYWDMPNILQMDINYPTEITFCFQIISKYYDNYYQNYHNNNNIYINWQPTLGIVEYKANLNNKEVTITCNLLQAILFSYLNEYECLTITDFSKKSNIPEKLSKKIFQSLFEDNIIIIKTNSNEVDTYVVNNKNYTGNHNIQSWKTFIEIFEKEKVDNSEIDNSIKDLEYVDDSDDEIPVVIDEENMESVKLNVKLLDNNTQKKDSDSDTDFDSDSDTDSELEEVPKKQNQNEDFYSDTDIDSELEDQVSKTTKVNPDNSPVDISYSDSDTEFELATKIDPHNLSFSATDSESD
uniref:Uncharacterized cullin-like protein n=1 Tax=Moumouvirus sp. 'Monve' TaxID=1128131 RepID=H2EE73_9VIRU|nr:uncharacterized cullin-like protein [Moumouvirus Monve]